MYRSRPLRQFHYLPENHLVGIIHAAWRCRNTSAVPCFVAAAAPVTSKPSTNPRVTWNCVSTCQVETVQCILQAGCRNMQKLWRFLEDNWRWLVMISDDDFWWHLMMFDKFWPTSVVVAMLFFLGHVESWSPEHLDANGPAAFCARSVGALDFLQGVSLERISGSSPRRFRGNKKIVRAWDDLKEIRSFIECHVVDGRKSGDHQLIDSLSHDLQVFFTFPGVWMLLIIIEPSKTCLTCLGVGVGGFVSCVMPRAQSRRVLTQDGWSAIERDTPRGSKGADKVEKRSGTMGVSKNRGIPNWMVYTGKPY